MRKSTLALAAVAVAVVGPPAYTQGVTVLEEIVVTARKREENLQEIPVSISVISSSLIDEAGIIEPRDFFELTPGVDFDTNGDRNKRYAGRAGNSVHSDCYHPAESHVLHRRPSAGGCPGYDAVHRRGAR